MKFSTRKDNTLFRELPFKGFPKPFQDATSRTLRIYVHYPRSMPDCLGITAHLRLLDDDAGYPIHVRNRHTSEGLQI